jgi:hypothetical protein
MKRYIFTVVLTLLLFFATVASLLMRLPVFAQTSTPTPGANIGQPITIDAPLVISGTKTLSAYKFVDSTDDTYFLDPSAATSLIVSGKVGIGTTAPGQELEINGDIFLSKGADRVIQVTGSTTGAGDDLSISAGGGTFAGGEAGGDLYLIGGQSSGVGSGNVYIYSPSQRPGEDVGAGNIILAYDSGVAVGKVGIGMASPLDRLHVLGTKDSSAAPSYAGILVSDSTAQAAGVGGGIVFRGKYTDAGAETTAGTIHAYKENSTTTQFGFAMAFNTRTSGGSNTEKMRIDNAGNVGIGMTAPTYKLQLNGQPAANGYTAWTNYSDARLKTNIKTLDSGYLDKIMQLKPSTFNYNELTGYDQDTRNRTLTGFIAQELQQIFPEMVGKNLINGVEYLDTDLSALQIYLVKGMQELNTKVDKLTIEAKKLVIDGVDVMKKLTELSSKVIELSNKVESQQKQIEELSKQIREMKN